jgi:hypothetical protein
MVSKFLDVQRTKLIKLVESKPQDQPEAVAAVALIDILELLERQGMFPDDEPS